MRGVISFPDDAEALESQKVVYIFDVLRVRADHGPEAAGCNHACLLAQLRKQKFEDAVDQPEISVVKARLQASDGVRANHACGLADLDSRQPGGAFEQRVGRD